jgi:hypothetical protein
MPGVAVCKITRRPKILQSFTFRHIHELLRMCRYKSLRACRARGFRVAQGVGAAFQAVIAA